MCTIFSVDKQFDQQLDQQMDGTYPILSKF